MNDFQDSTIMQNMLREAKTIAVVGLSDKAERSSYGVSDYMKDFYEIIPINPNLEQWQGKKAYPNLQAVPGEIEIDIVNVFRKSSEVAEIVEASIARKVPSIWLQQGVIDQSAAERARIAGVSVIMDACIAVAHSTMIK